MDTDTYFDILRYLETLELSDDFDSNQCRSFKRKAHFYVSIDGLLYKKNKDSPTRPLRVLKKSELAAVLYNFHEDPLAGHFGFSETYRAISLRYFWPQMGNDIRSYVQSCDVCQRRKRPLRNEPLHPIKIGQPFDRVGMDIVGPLPITLCGNKTIRQHTTRFEPFYLTYGREATLPIELKLPSDPTIIGSDAQQDQQVEDFQEQFYQRIRMLIGPLEDNRQLARSNVHTSQETQKL
ncbi:unnamed protein product [Rhizophagus irregularis]|nr:unnamed protein product [Rhizophagus irregularis]